MKVILLTHTQDALETIYRGYKECYSSAPASEIPALLDDDMLNFIEKKTELGHESPLEHVSFTFSIEGISRACSHQLVRHRIASYSQQSQRYVRSDDFEYIVPKSISEKPFVCAEYDALMETIQRQYAVFVELYKIPKEDARYILPNAATTNIVVTMNVRSLLNFFKLRMDKTAQWEIREMATEIFNIVQGELPFINNKGEIKNE